jgi:vitamin B12 transporter
MLRTPLGAAALVALLAPTLLHAQQNPVRLDTLVVTASTPIARPLEALGNHVSVIDGGAIRAAGITRVEDALRGVPGVNLVRLGSYGGTTSIFMRGVESDQVQVLIDGVPINQPGGAVDLGGISVENIERIEVSRGPASALSGSDALGGVIQIVTRGGEEGFRGSAFGRIGGFGRQDGGLELSGGSESASYSLSATRYYTDGILDFNNAHDNTVLSGRIDVRPDDATTIRFSANLSDRQFNFPTDGAGNVVDRNAFTFQDRATLGLLVEREVGERLGLRLLISSTDEETGTDDEVDDAEDTSSFVSLSAFRRLGIDLRGNLAVGETSTLTLGGEFEEQDIRDFNESVSSFGTFGGRSANARSNVAGYAHWTGAFEGLDANAGVRVEDNEFFGTFTTWQLGASAPVGDALRLRGSVGRGIKEPTFFESFATGFARGNPDLDPEQSLSWEVGADYEVGGVTLGATYFDQAIEDLIQFTSTPPNPSDPSYFNVAEATIRGLELDAALRVGPIEVDGSWTWLDSEVVDAGFQSGESATFVEGQPLIRRPESTLRLNAATQATSTLRLSAALERVGERDDRDFATFPATPVTLDAYTLVDAAVTWTPFRSGLGGDVRLIGRVENLLDQDFVGAAGFVAPGRVVTLELRAGFGD